MLRVPKRSLFFALVALAAGFYFHQFVLLQLWRSISGQFVLSTIISLLGVALWTRLAVRWPGATDASAFEVGRRDLAAAGALFLASLVTWALFAFPNLSASVHTFGDEDHHLLTTRETWQYLRTYFSGTLPTGGGPNAYRYPGLIYFWAQFFSGFSPVVGFYERLSLFFPFAATSLVAFLWCRLEAIAILPSVIFGLLFATSPLLLTYTTDFYLDIGHPVLAIAAFALLARFFRGSNRSGVGSAVCASLLFFVRDNALPTTAVVAFALFCQTLYRDRSPRGFRRGTVLGVLTLLPPVLYLVLKTRATLVDTARLSVQNLFLQDYVTFFAYLLFYCGPYFLLGALTRRRLFLGLLALAFVGELLVYGLFQPGWIPWSRNYMMFLGPLAGMGILGLASLPRNPTAYRAALGILGLQVVFQGYGLIAQFNRNEYFHENEIRFEYREFFARIARETPDACAAGILTNVPIAIPWSWRQALPALGPCQLSPIVASPGSPFADFSELLKQHAARPTPFFIYQWRRARTHIPVLQALPSAPPPPRDLPQGVKLLFSQPDPWSEGEAGLALYRWEKP